MSVSTSLTGYPAIDKPWMKYYSKELESIEIPKMTLYTYAYHNNLDNMNGIAFQYFGSKITYKKLFLEIQKAAKAFQKAGVSAGDVVTIMSMQTPETIYAYFALNYLGAVANMVYMTLSEAEILQTVRDTKSKMLLFLETVAEKVAKSNIPSTVQTVSLSVSSSMPFLIQVGYKLKNKNNSELLCDDYRAFIDNGANEILCAPEENADLPAVIVYTSGTTGEPKGVVLSSYNINSVAFQYKYSGMHFGRGESYLGIIPLFLAYGVAMLQLAVSMGINTTLFIVPEPKEIAKAFEKTKPNHFASGPAMLDDIMKNVTGDMSYLINFTGGGAALSAEKEEQLNLFLASHNCHVKYAIGYGMTELAAAVCANSNLVYKQGSLGIPLPKATVRIVDPDTEKDLKIGETGEICFNAPNTMLGYYNNEKATDEIISVDTAGQRWIRTGDLGYVDEDGFLFYQGKMKRIYVCRTASGLNMKLFPQRIEELFEENSSIDKCAVVAIEDNTYLHVAIAFVTRKPSAQLNKDSLIRELKEVAEANLPEHSLPAKIIVLDEMPLTASGKVDYRVLEEMAKGN